MAGAPLSSPSGSSVTTPAAAADITATDTSVVFASLSATAAAAPSTGAPAATATASSSSSSHVTTRLETLVLAGCHIRADGCLSLVQAFKMGTCTGLKVRQDHPHTKSMYTSLFYAALALGFHFFLSMLFDLFKRGRSKNAVLSIHYQREGVRESLSEYSGTTYICISDFCFILIHAPYCFFFFMCAGPRSVP